MVVVVPGHIGLLTVVPVDQHVRVGVEEPGAVIIIDGLLGIV